MTVGITASDGCLVYTPLTRPDGSGRDALIIESSVIESGPAGLRSYKPGHVTTSRASYEAGV